jgi:hypothetical protein
MKLSFLSFGLLALLVGCAHSTMRGTVAMKVTDEELHVCMGEKEVKAGDHVAFFFNQCRPGGKETRNDICTKIKLGEGEVVRTLNEHYSVVRPNPGVKVQEGTVVEKI